MSRPNRIELEMNSAWCYTPQDKCQNCGHVFEPDDTVAVIYMAPDHGRRLKVLNCLHCAQNSTRFPDRIITKRKAAHV